jgi:murein L,D-transpeptidase YcbB/YkuD
LRIDMPNKDAVYMHDTPSKGLFSASVRFQSHGCVRVSKVEDLAAWLLENNSGADQAAANQPSNPSGWSAQTIDAAITLGTRMDVKLTKPVPVAWVYLTGYATPDHVVHFRNDVYDLDNGIDNTPTASIPVRPQQQSSAGTGKLPAATGMPQVQAVKALAE